MQNKNILLVGEWYSANLGDQILCSCVQNIILKNFKRINTIKFDTTYGNGMSWKKKISVLPHRIRYKFNKDVKQRTDDYNRLKCNWIKSDLRSLNENIDIIIVCGGQIFLDYFVDNIRLIVNYAHLNSIPIIWNAVGAGKCTDKTIGIFKECLESKLNKTITVRDNLPFFVNKLNVIPKLIPDTAITVSDFITVDKNNENLIGLGVMNPNDFKDFNIPSHVIEFFWINLTKKLDENNINWEFFTNGAASDIDFLQRLLTKLDNTKIKVAPRPRNPIDLTTIINKYNKIVSFRLHSHIIAYSYRIPSLGLKWDYKVSDFFKMTQNEENVITLDNINIQNVVTFIKKGNSNFEYLNNLKKEITDSIISNLNRYLA